MTQEEFFKRYTYSPSRDRIGGGGFGTVYKAKDNVLHREVAIKVSEVKTTDNGKKTFSLKDEFEALNHVPKHPNIANYEEFYSFEMPNGIFDYAVMQYYPDGNLSNAIKEGLTDTQKEDVATQLLEGISFLHQNKVVHRDLKPGNILIVRDGDKVIPLITDFGLSKTARTGDGSVFTNSFGGGTPRYSSPEQIQGQPLRFNTDLWSFGAILYEVFTGQQLFSPGSGASNTAQADLEIFNKIINGDVQNLGKMPEKWRKVAECCLVVDPTKRAKDATELFVIIRGDDDETEMGDSGNVGVGASASKRTEQLPSNPSKPSSMSSRGTKQSIGAGGSEPPKTIHDEKPKNKRGLWIGLGIAAVVMVTLLLLLKPKQEPTPTDFDTQAYQACQTVADYKAYIKDYGRNALHYTDAKAFVDQYVADSTANAQQALAEALAQQQAEANGKNDGAPVTLSTIEQTPSSTQRPANTNTQLTAQQNFDKGKKYYDKKQYTDAESYLRKAADQNHANAQYYLGIMYENGYGVSKDYANAIKWYRKAAEQGCAFGQHNLGAMYENGYGVKKDYTEAVKWYRNAAEQGYINSQAKLGNLYHNGLGVAKDYVEAVKWYRKAAEQGSDIAQFLLGFMYQNGLGVTKDNTEALEWYRKAAAQGNEDAEKKVTELSVSSSAETHPLGLFSVSSNCKVYFAKGNLQYQASTNSWQIASNPWDVIGKANENISPSYSGWIDMFGWGTGDDPTKTSGNDENYASFTDWGPKYKNGWRTLTNEEWRYVFSKRSTSSGIRYVKAKVNGMNGVILLPDNWDKSIYSLNNANNEDADYESNSISASTWNSTFSPAKAVFLPAAGYRYGRRDVAGVGSEGGYWSSSNAKGPIALCLYFYDGRLIDCSSNYHHYGYSVRLVRNAQ